MDVESILRLVVFAPHNGNDRLVTSDSVEDEPVAFILCFDAFE